MLSIMVLIESRPDRNLFATALESMKVHCIITEPNYSNYVKAVQYMPDIIFMEIPQKSAKQYHFIQMLKQHNVARQIPIICFGDKVSDEHLKGMERVGITRYFPRPVDMRAITDFVNQKIRLKDKSQQSSSAHKTTLKPKDIETILSPRVGAEEKIVLMASYVNGLMAFPFTVSKVIQLANNDATGAGDLAKVIESDPVISTNLLKICNSVLFASSHRRISSIKDAVVRIGFSETRRIAMSMSIMRLFEGTTGNFGFNRVNYWMHSLTTAIVAQQIAKKIPEVNSDEAFLAGLLHDFGILLLDEFFSPLFNRLLEVTTNRAARFVEIEKEILGVTHIDLTQRLFHEWKIPDPICQAIKIHYTVLSSPTQPDTAGTRLALCAAIGNIVAKTFGFGASCDQYVMPIPNWALQQAKMPLGIRQTNTEVIDAELAQYQEFLKIKSDRAVKTKSSEPKLPAMKIGFINLCDELCIPAELYLAERGYLVMPMKLADHLTPADMKPDFILLNLSDQTDTHETGKRLQAAGLTPVTRTDGTSSIVLPAIALISRTSSLHTEPSSVLSCMFKDFDLRQVEESIHTVLQGELVTPLTAVPRKTPAAHAQEQSQHNQTLLISIQNTALTEAVTRLQAECKQKSVKNIDAQDAETLSITASLKISNGMHLDANWMLQLAQAFFQKAILRHEAEQYNVRIESILKSITPEQRLIYERLLKQ